MAITCWAPECNHNNKRETCKFFRFPKDGKVFRKWITLLRRDEQPGAGARVCSCHFRDGNKANCPEIFVHSQETLFGEHHLTPEKKKRKVVPAITKKPSSSLSAELIGDVEHATEAVAPSLAHTQTTEIVLSQSTSASACVPSTQACSSHMGLAEGKHSITMLESENYLLNLELERKDQIIKTLWVQMSFSSICDSDKLILEYTGLPAKSSFEALYKYIEHIEINYYLKWKVEKLCRKDQLLLTLMKLRQNFTHIDLAFRFKISEATVTNIVVTFIHILYESLFKKLMANIPSRQKNQSCLPNCASSFTNCRIIVDCTDFFCAVPRQSMKKQKLTYSSYKHRNSLKGLIGVAPNGVVTFVSSLYPGSTSDKAIFKHSPLIATLEPGDVILADKGFLIQDLVPSGVSVNLPPFLCTPQFSPEQIQQTKCIARARIHVERAIRRIKSFKILTFIPESLYRYSSIIVKVVAALTNLQYPLIKEVSQFYLEREI